jgi:hypothetical protein
MPASIASELVTKYCELNYAHLDEGAPCIQVAESGPMQVISIVSGRKHDARFATVIVSVGRDPMDGVEKFFEEKELGVLFFESKIVLSTDMGSDGRTFEFDFDRSRTSDEAAIREVMKIFKIEDHWGSARTAAPD